MKEIFTYILIFCAFIGKGQSIDYSKFIGKPVHINQYAQLDEPSVFEYIDDLYQIKITNKIIDNKPERIIPENNTIFSNKINEDPEKENYILLISNFSFNYQGKETIIIKYRVFEHEILSNIKTVLVHKINDNWLEFDDIYLHKIKELFKVLKLDAFFQFYDSNNNPSYPEINKLKPLVKDDDGILNIFKLIEITEKNKAILSKYFE